MLNKIWPVFIIISFVYAIIFGNIEKLNNGIFESTKSAVELCLTFLGTITLWNGIMQIAYKSRLVNNLVKILNPFLNKLFPELKNNQKIKKEISMNIIANIFGLGNAATPLGIKAMQSMQKNNKQKDKLTNSMVMFIVINTASLQIIPTTVIAIRNSLGSNNPTKIIFPVWIATIVAAVIGIFVTKLFIKLDKRG